MRSKATQVIQQLAKGVMCPDWRKHVGPWNEGYEAHHQGRPSSFNPHSRTKDPDAHWAWSIGWHLADAQLIRPSQCP